MGLRSLEDGYVPPILDVSQARPEAARLERRVGRRGPRAARPRRDLRRRLGRRGRARRAAHRRGAARGLDRRRACSPTAAGSTSPPTSGVADDVERVDGDHALVVIPAAIRAELRAHAAEEAPNECCGVIVLRDGVAERYVRGRNRARLAVPLRARDRPRGVVPRGRGLRARRLPLAPGDASRSRRAPTASSSGLWAGKPFLIYGLKLDELRAWTITRESVEELPLSAG